VNVRLLRKRHQPPPHPVIRLARILGGVLLVIIGLIFLVTPGQGILTILAGLWLMSADVRLARRSLVRLRVAARRIKRRYRAHRRARALEAKERGSRDPS
jgi:UPF0716 family protein affecting phage T7 exclusion